MKKYTKGTVGRAIQDGELPESVLEDFRPPSGGMNILEIYESLQTLGK